MYTLTIKIQIETENAEANEQPNMINYYVKKALAKITAPDNLNAHYKIIPGRAKVLDINGNTVAVIEVETEEN